MKKEIAKIWIEALRSGKYSQGKHRLASTNEDYCCLGVLCDLAEKRGIVKSNRSGTENFYDFVDSVIYNGAELDLPAVVKEWAGMRSESGAYSYTGALTDDNDNGKTFAEIADIIEREVENL